MPITKSAKKAVRVSKRKRVFNDRRRRAMKEAIKNLRKLGESKNRAGAEKALPAMYKAIDKAAKRGIVKKNTAARKKSRLTKLVQSIGK